MSDQLNVPTTKPGINNRKQSDTWAELSGQRFCTSCQRSKPKDEVKIYKPRGKNSTCRGMPRCDECQKRRLEILNARRG